MRAAIQGYRFGKLTVLGVGGENSCGRFVWLCQCDCGGTTRTTTQKLRSGHTKSCGCLANTTHGMARTRTYSIYQQMHQRCRNKKKAAYGRYGARGIKVCARWHDFGNFLADMGPAPEGMTLERKDNMKGYSLSNCKWATWPEQYRNRRTNVFYTIDGRRQCQKDWCAEFGIDEGTFTARLTRGWPLVRALSEPARKQNRL